MCDIDVLFANAIRLYNQAYNYGKHGWHIHHVIPCALFDLLDPYQQHMCFNWSNLLPEYAEINWSLNCRITHEKFQEQLKVIKTQFLRAGIYIQEDWERAVSRSEGRIRPR